MPIRLRLLVLLALNRRTLLLVPLTLPFFLLRTKLLTGCILYSLPILKINRLKVFTRLPSRMMLLIIIMAVLSMMPFVRRRFMRRHHPCQILWSDALLSEVISLVVYFSPKIVIPLLLLLPLVSFKQTRRRMFPRPRVLLLLQLLFSLQYGRRGNHRRCLRIVGILSYMWLNLLILRFHSLPLLLILLLPPLRQWKAIDVHLLLCW
mmetsp:Transcript_395/g.951  ORF Transcript_395/g.951 Transcript_395/m.951 type:complete len:206 (-) Transcript_395:776-1393(-)